MNGHQEIKPSQFAPDAKALIGRLRRKKIIVTVYGLFSPDGRCHYVGQTAAAEAAKSLRGKSAKYGPMGQRRAK